VSAFASVGIHVIGEENQLLAGWNSGALRSRNPVMLLDDTCRIAPVEKQPQQLREVARTLSARRFDPSVVMVVTGSLTPRVELRQLATLFNPDTVFTAVTADVSAEPAVHHVGPVVTASVRTLRDLPHMITRLGTRQ
jgi:hypothetical protein